MVLKKKKKVIGGISKKKNCDMRKRSHLTLTKNAIWVGMTAFSSLSWREMIKKKTPTSAAMQVVCNVYFDGRCICILSLLFVQVSICPLLKISYFDANHSCKASDLLSF